MKQKELLTKEPRNKMAHSAKECAYLAVFVAVTIALQSLLAVVPGVELVTVMFVAYSFAVGAKRGVIAAVAFSFLRQFVFGVYPKVLVLYLLYFPLLAVCFGCLGKRLNPAKGLFWIVVVACCCTVCFTLTDNVLTPLWLGYTARDAKLYFLASLPFLLPQVLSTAVSVAVLFLPLYKIFNTIQPTR